MKLAKFIFKNIIIFSVIFVIYTSIYHYQVKSTSKTSLKNTFLASIDSMSNIQSKEPSGIGVRNYGLAEDNIDKNGFYIRIDKINLFKPVVKNVDPRYKEVYVESWKTGVSHGKFTSTPEKIGNVYLFAHSVSDVSKMNEENAWFTEIDLLSENDEIILYYEGKKYSYQVSKIYSVEPTATGVYTGVSSVPKVTLQTCGPPRGSINSRYMVEGLLKSVSDF